MRDVLIEKIHERMKDDENIFFLSADLGAPQLDKLRTDHKDRFINVGIAEQNLVNIAAGLALEGFTVYAYAIATFLSMRAFEQIRNNLSLLGQTRKINVNLIGVGGGLSYDVAGPSHHCLEDISVIRTLPNIDIFSPSDFVLVEKYFEKTVSEKRPKYLRFDGKPVPAIYSGVKDLKIEKGFYELSKGKDICLVTTGHMTHKALRLAKRLAEEKVDIGVVDVFLLRPFDAEGFYRSIRGYKTLITLEEGFIEKGGLDSLISSVLCGRDSGIKLKRLGFSDTHVFKVGTEIICIKYAGWTMTMSSGLSKAGLKIFYGG